MPEKPKTNLKTQRVRLDAMPEMPKTRLRSIFLIDMMLNRREEKLETGLKKKPERAATGPKIKQETCLIEMM